MAGLQIVLHSGTCAGRTKVLGMETPGAPQVPLFLHPSFYEIFRLPFYMVTFLHGLFTRWLQAPRASILGHLQR